MNSIENNTKLNRGFTLIELLVVIAIIGILSSVVLASLSTARAKSRDARRIADIDQVRTALELYNDSFSTYPTSTGRVDFTSAAPGFLSVLVTQGLIARLPSDPTAGNKYYYQASADSAYTVAGTVNAVGYILAANLERNDNPALKTDADKNFSGSMSGGAADCTNASAGADQCYDVIP